MSEAAPSADELIAKPEGPDWAEGAGIVSDLNDLFKVGKKADDGPGIDPSRISGSQAEAALGGVGISVLALRGNPVEGLAAAGVGWLIEHVGFLREPFDQLAGDPNEIKAHAQTWHNVGRELGRIAEEQRRRLGQLGSWQGAAADAYRAAAGRQTEALRQSAGSAEELAGEIMNNGTAVASVRAVVRDTIADFIVKLAEWVVAALPFAAASAGASLAAVVAGAVASAVRTAEKLAELIAKLLARLSESGAKLGKLATAAESAASGLASGANGLRKGGEAVADDLRQFAKDITPSPRPPKPPPPMLGEQRSRWDIDPPRSFDEVVDRFLEDQAKPERIASGLAEPGKQQATAERDREKWTPL